MDPKVEVMKAAHQRITLNHLGLPEGIFRPDLLPGSLNEAYLDEEIEAPSSGPSGPFGPSRDPRDPNSEGDFDVDFVVDGVSSVGDDGHGSASSLSANLSSDPAGEDFSEVTPAEIETDDGWVSANQLVAHVQRSRQPLIDRELLAIAYVPLSYDEGYPVIYGFLPFWERLPFEPLHAYAAFQKYLEQGRTGARQLFTLAANETRRNLPSVNEPNIDNDISNGNGIDVDDVDTNTLVEKSLAQYQTLEKYQSWFYMYYWKYRTEAYDMFQAAVQQRVRAQAAMSVETEHTILGKKLMEKLTEKLFGDNAEDDFWEVLTPQAAITLLDKVMEIQRVSVGLPAKGPPKQEVTETNMEVGLRKVASSMRVGNEPIQKAASTDDIRNQLLANPEAAQIAQELVLKVSQRRVA